MSQMYNCGRHWKASEPWGRNYLHYVLEDWVKGEIEVSGKCATRNSSVNYTIMDNVARNRRVISMKNALGNYVLMLELVHLHVKHN